jgi:methyl-accepting chemotaxis protein
MFQFALLILSLAAVLAAILSGAAARHPFIVTVCLLAALATAGALAVHPFLALRHGVNKLYRDEVAFLESDLKSLKQAIVELSQGNLSVRTQPSRDTAAPAAPQDASRAAPAPSGDDPGDAGFSASLGPIRDAYRRVGDGLSESSREFNLVTDFPCQRIFYVGADSVMEGRRCGDVMGRLLGGRGKTAIIMGSRISAAQSLRRKGFESALLEKYPDMEIVAVREDQRNRELAYTVTQELLQTHPDLAGIYTTQGSTPGRIAQAVIDSGPEAAARIKIVTHDLAADTMSYLARGVIAATFSQNPFAQGHDPVILLYNYLLTKEAPVIIRHLTLLEEVTRATYAEHWDNKSGSLVTDQAKAALAQPLPNKTGMVCRIAVILHDDKGFWEPVAAGVRQAARTLSEYGSEVRAIVPESIRNMDFSVGAFVDPINRLIKEGYQAICLPLFNRDLVPFLNQKTAEGIAIATYNSEPVSLRGMIDSVNRHAGHLFRVSEHMAAGATQNAQAIERVSTTMKLLVKGSLNQMQHQVRTDELIQELIRSIQYVQEETTESIGTADRTKETARAGQDAIRQTQEAMKLLERNARETSASIRLLNDNILKIDEITAFIENIATQTNLLAINASIQAAQAGESGRGFTVVAQEIHSLAEQATKATSDIAALVDNVLSGVDRATAAVRTSSGQVEESAAMTAQTEAAFRNITRATEENQVKVTGILTQARLMLATSEEVQKAMAELNRLNEDNGAAVQEITGSVEQMSREISGINATAQRLKDMGRSQENLLTQFILE